jgi:hypothetical protein
MKRKLATKTNGAGHRASGLRRETDVVSQRLQTARACGSAVYGSL